MRCRIIRTGVELFPQHGQVGDGDLTEWCLLGRVLASDQQTPQSLILTIG
jgi:hypothetical protein